MSSSLGKRKLPRRELPFVGKLLDNLSYARLPTNMMVLRRLLFHLEQNPGTSAREAAKIVEMETREVYDNAGYGDILHQQSNTVEIILKLHSSYRDLGRIPSSRHKGPSFLKLEANFNSSGSQLFPAVVQSLISSNRIHDADRDFILNHWDKTISTTRDLKTKAAVETKLAREEKRQRFISKHSSSSPPSTSKSVSSSWAREVLDAPIPSPDPSPDYLPKRPCSEKPSGTSLHLPKNILSVIGPIADRVGLSNMQVSALTAGIVNHCGGDIDDLSLSKSTARRHRATSRAQKAKVCVA